MRTSQKIRSRELNIITSDIGGNFDRKFFIMIRNIFLGVLMAAEREVKFQRHIFSPSFRRFHYAYNILDGTIVQKKKWGTILISTYCSVLLCTFYISRYLSNEAAFLANIDRYNRAAFDFIFKKKSVYYSDTFPKSDAYLRARYIYI